MANNKFDSASLVLIPSGKKVGKVYAQKPHTGLGDLDFSRATTASYIGPDGLIHLAAINEPRFDWLDRVNGGVLHAPMFLLEPQRTNLALFSEEFNNAYWTKFGSSVTANNAASPDGFINADKFIANTTSNIHFAIGAIANIAAPWTYSVFAKAAGYDRLIMWVEATNYVGFNLTTGIVESTLGIGITSANIQNYGNGWYRCSITSTSTSSGTVVAFAGFNAAFTDGNINPIFAGNGTDGILIYGAQLEAGSVATSYIPTVASTVTRGADVCSKAGISSLIGQAEGTVYMEIDDFSTFINNQGLCFFDIIGSTDADRIAVLLLGNSDILVFINANSVIILNETISTTGLAGSLKLAFAYKNNDIALYINGVQKFATSLASFTFSTPLNTFFLGSRFSQDEQLSFPINSAIIYTTRLSNSSLQEITTL